MNENKNIKSAKSGQSNKSVVQTAYKYSELTGKIIGCAMRVHSALGNGFQEVIYQRALEIEMADEGIAFTREQEMPIYYKSQQIGTRRVDFLVEGVVSVELKAITKLEDIHLAQAINYLEAYDLEIGLLINFGSKSLEHKRVINRKFKQQNQGNPQIK
jgi:GxxExxY protein